MNDAPSPRTLKILAALGIDPFEPPQGEPAGGADTAEPIPVDRTEISADGDRPAPAPEPCRPPAGIPAGKASGAIPATVDKISADISADGDRPAPAAVCGICRALGSRDGRPWCFAVVFFEAKPDRGKPVSTADPGCKRFSPRPD